MRDRRSPNIESSLETAISYGLITGVIISLLLEITGIFLYYYEYGHLTISVENSMFIKGNNFFSFLFNLLQRKVEGTSILFMTAGLVVLMLTPFFRVIMSVVYFSLGKNLKYVWLSLYVLLVLTVSLFLH